MAIKVIREESDSPNITNKVDARMIRYAYGGINGVIQGYGEECESVSEGNGIFRIQNGIIVIDGWEIEIYETGHILDFSDEIGTQYHSVYIEFNALTQSANIKSRFSPSVFLGIDKGDDLTTSPNGTARLLLYDIKTVDGKVTMYQKMFELIANLKDTRESLFNHITISNTRFENIEKKLTTLEDYLTKTIYGNATLNYHIGNIALKSQSVQKNQNNIKITLEFADKFTAEVDEGIRTAWTIYVEEQFRPASTLTIPVLTSGNIESYVQVGNNGYISYKYKRRIDNASIVVYTIPMTFAFEYSI